MVHSILGLMRPLRSGLNVSKIHLIFLCGVTEQHHSPAKWWSERGFSSMHRFQVAPRESSFIRVQYQHFFAYTGYQYVTALKKNLIKADILPNGACEGTLTCSTCHLIFDKDTFQKLDAISDEELDMLDLAYELTHKPPC
ncbi:hypothetical protein HGM15179_019389 [Zosterops borbonicus]|uniref:Uncharacterized protein n=1 Tax=Zosterops borbonicus TaxID=364589 RepID=A0A8K1FV62_9PASS|nr:hypothetical protein HGM15179_019389 [Zosterops borbonicus]